MTKKNKIVIIILAVILALTGTFAVLSLNSDILDKVLGGPSTKTQDLASVLSADFESEYPLVQTQKKDLFYEVHPDGAIKFYSFVNGTFTPYSGKVDTKSIKVTCSYQEIPVKLYYTKTDAGMIGYGLFTADQSKDVKLFSYVFVRMMTCPAAYKNEARTDNIILVDMDKEDVYKPDKTYSDIYSLDLSSGKTVQIISQRDRLVQENGTFREDWDIFTDNSLNSMTKHNLFISARNHDTAAEIREYDVMSIANSKAFNKNSTTTVSSVPNVNLWFDNNDYYCLANTDNGFDLIKNGDKKAPLTSFEGVFAEDYMVSGNWIFNKAKSEFTSAISAETTGVKKISLDSFSGFAANSDGTKFVVFGNRNQSEMILCDKNTNSQIIVEDSNIFDTGILNFCFIDDSTVLVSTYNDSKGAINHICKF